MDTYIVTSEQIAVILKTEETADLFQLVRACLIEHGLPAWSSPKIDLFIRGDQRLLLARPSPPRRHRTYSGEPRIRRRS